MLRQSRPCCRTAATAAAAKPIANIDDDVGGDATEMEINRRILTLRFRRAGGCSASAHDRQQGYVSEVLALLLLLQAS